MEQKNNKAKIVITVRLEPRYFDRKVISGYNIFNDFEKCYEIYRLYSEKNGSRVFTIPEFQNYLRTELKVKNEMKELEPFFEKIKEEDLSYKEVFENDNFIKWIECNDNRRSLVNALSETKSDFLVRKSPQHEIYVLPVLNHDFDYQNIKYIETIIDSFQKEDGDLYLLLHDKDLYSDHKKNQPVSDRDELGSKLEDSSLLKTLINDNKVFVFQHNDQDEYYKKIIKKLDILSINEIIKKLEEQALVVLFAKKISKYMRKSEMEKDLDDEESNKYDFSKPFLY